MLDLHQPDNALLSATHEVDPRELHMHPDNEQIYGRPEDEDPRHMARLRASIKQQGVIEPIIVAGGVIISGHLRWSIAIELGLPSVPVQYHPATDVDEITELIIAANDARIKSNLQKARELFKLNEVQERRANARQSMSATATNEKRAQSSSPVTLCVTLPTASQEDKGRAITIAATKVNMKTSTAQKALKTLNAIDIAKQHGYSDAAQRIINELNESFNAGYKEAKASGFLPQSILSSHLTPLNGIDWARWQWDLVTGCPRNCADCPARAYAEASPALFIVDKDQIEKQQAQRAKIFDACLHADALRAPCNTPAPCSDDPAHFRVLACWYTDIFDSAIPPNWRAELLKQISECSNGGQRWQFLLRTCQPQYLPEMDWPDNVEICITVTRQAQVAAAEAAMKKLRARCPNLPVNLLYDPGEEALHFSTLAGFSWLYLGCLPGAPARDDARHMTLDELYALRAQTALAGCAFTRSPGIHLAELDEYSGMLNDANKLVRELYQQMGRWIQH